MQPEPWMTDPSWFLVVGLPWPEDHPHEEVAEAAFAIAPFLTQAVRPMSPDGNPVPLGRDLELMLDAGSRCAAALGKRVLFLSDITRWLADLGLTWERIGVSFEIAQNELEQQPIGIYLSVSQRAHAILCSVARTLTIHYTSGGATQIPPEDRELIRENFEAALDADWSGYATQALASTPPAA